MTEESLKDLIIKFNRGIINTEELLELKRFIALPEAQAMIESMDFADMPVRDMGRVSDLETMYDRIEQRMRKPAVAVTAGRQPGIVVTIMKKYRYALAAASVLFLIAGAWLWLKTERASSGEVAWTQVGTLAGQRRKIVLPDGSMVYLGARSRIKYPARFTGSMRKIELEGEAFFDVKKGADRAFEVQTPHNLTTVLGTRFNVEAYGWEKMTRVALVEGKVRAGNADSSVILSPGQMWSADNANRYQHVKNIGIESKDWIAGNLVLNDMPLHEALRRIGNFYGIEVDADSTVIRNYSITGSFGDDKAEKVLDALLAVYDLQWKKMGDKYIVIPRR